MRQTSDSDFHRVSDKTGQEQFTVKAVLCMAGALMILLIIGAQLSWGNMSSYIASYYYWKALDGQVVTSQQFMIV